MSLDLFVCCEKAIVDERSGNVSLINVWDGVSVQVFPLIFPSVTTVMSFSKSEGQEEFFDGVVKFDIDGDPLFDGPFSVDFEGASGSRVIAQLDRMAIPKSGRLTAVAYVKDQEVGRYSMLIEKSGDQ